MLSLVTLLLSFGLTGKCHGQDTVIGSCVAFAPDGALATGTLRNGDLETKLDQPGAGIVTTHAAIEGSPSRDVLQRCEEAFSADRKWLATVVPGRQLAVVVLDRRTGTVHRTFSSEWFRLRDMSMEPWYRSSFLGGFLQDDSVVLWRYVPRSVADTSDASHVDLHLQRWSVEGELLSDQDLGPVGFGPAGRQPISFNGLGLLWIPGKCDVTCYKGLKVAATQVEEQGLLKLPDDNAAQPTALPGDQGFLTVLGRTAQKAVSLDLSGRLTAKVSLPFFPNLFGPLVPDWFHAYQPALSHDGEFAAIARTRVAWVLVDSDRDWGSEIVLLRMHPLAVATRLKIGKGVVGQVAVDHQDGIVRLVGFWKGSWHEVKCDDRQLNKCR